MSKQESKPLPPRQSLYKTPFSGGYWRLAAADLKSVRMLVLAAMLTAMRIAIRGLSIHIGPGLRISFGFLVNSVGSMIYGPLLAIITSAITDTLGWMVFPDGAYFFPFIFLEIAGGVLYALFYYRAKLSAVRVLLGHFSVTLICNIIISPCLLYYYFLFYMGTTYNILSLPRLIINLALFPVESVVLVLLFNALLPLTDRMGLTHTGRTKMHLGKKEIVLLVVMTLISAAAIAVYYGIRGFGS